MERINLLLMKAKKEAKQSEIKHVIGVVKHVPDLDKFTLTVEAATKEDAEAG